MKKILYIGNSFCGFFHYRYKNTYRAIGVGYSTVCLILEYCSAIKMLLNLVQLCYIMALVLFLIFSNSLSVKNVVAVCD